MVLPAIAALAAASAAVAAPTQKELMKQATITKSQAEKIAINKVRGAKIQSEELENEHGALVWSFDLVKSGTKNVTEVLVNAKTGRIVSVTKETPSDQAREAAADKKGGHR